MQGEASGMFCTARCLLGAHARDAAASPVRHALSGARSRGALERHTARATRDAIPRSHTVLCRSWCAALPTVAPAASCSERVRGAVRGAQRAAASRCALPGRCSSEARRARLAWERSRGRSAAQGASSSLGDLSWSGHGEVHCRKFFWGVALRSRCLRRSGCPESRSVGSDSRS